MLPPRTPELNSSHCSFHSWIKRLVSQIFPNKRYFFNERGSLLLQKSQQRMSVLRDKIVATELKNKGIQLPQLIVEEKKLNNYYIQ